MEKAGILDFFAGMILLIGIIVAGVFVIQGTNDPFNGTASYLLALAVFFGSLFQYAIFGGMAEVIKRLVSIDESLQDVPSLPPTSATPPPRPVTPTPQPELPEIGRASRR
jgi:hypothetical protein